MNIVKSCICIPLVQWIYTSLEYHQCYTEVCSKGNNYDGKWLILVFPSPPHPLPPHPPITSLLKLCEDKRIISQNCLKFICLQDDLWNALHICCLRRYRGELQVTEKSSKEPVCKCPQVIAAPQTMTPKCVILSELDETIPNLCVLSMVKKQNPVQIWICTEKCELP